MKLYLLRGCPFAHRATTVLAEKGLAFEPVFFEPGKRPPELVAVGPNAKSPTLFDGDTQVWDAQIVCEYLDERTPSPALMPREPAARAEVRMVLAQIGSGLGARQGALVAEALFKPEPQRDQAKVAELEQGVVDAMEPWDRHLAGRSFLVGDALTLADITLFTMLGASERAAGVGVPASQPHLRAWYDSMRARPTTALLT